SNTRTRSRSPSRSPSRRSASRTTLRSRWGSCEARTRTAATWPRSRTTTVPSTKSLLVAATISLKVELIAASSQTDAQGKPFTRVAYRVLRTPVDEGAEPEVVAEMAEGFPADASAAAIRSALRAKEAALNEDSKNQAKAAEAAAAEARQLACIDELNGAEGPDEGSADAEKE